MQIPVLTALILIFLVWLQYEISKSTKLSKKNTDHFWENESNSNQSRRGDISKLDYITIEVDRLPIKDTTDPTINSYRDTIIKLTNQKIVNLTGLTNTELKYRYGVSNLNELSEYDNNYIILVSILHKWAERLYNYGYKGESKTVLEYAISIHTDVTKSYKLLATLYKEAGDVDSIDHLITALPKTKISDPDKLIGELQKAKLF